MRSSAHGNYENIAECFKTGLKPERSTVFAYIAHDAAVLEVEYLGIKVFVLAPPW